MEWKQDCQQHPFSAIEEKQEGREEANEVDPEDTVPESLDEMEGRYYTQPLAVLHDKDIISKEVT